MEFQFTKEYKVHVYEIGPDGRLNLYSLFNYLQDIASVHAVQLGFGKDDLMDDNRFWVLSRIYTVIKEWPVWEDTIVVKTWPNGPDSIFALRNYEVTFPDGRHILSATSSWLILDRTTKKILRSDSILSRFNHKQTSEVSHIRNPTKLKPADKDGSISPGHTIKISDLDVNLHTNNVSYLKWVSDTYNLDFILKNSPQSVEINYLSETLYNEEIIIKSSSEEGAGTMNNHSIFRTGDNKELCRIKIEWKEELPDKN
jgi:acyl-ACP thioesterase